MHGHWQNWGRWVEFEGHCSCCWVCWRLWRSGWMPTLSCCCHCDATETGFPTSPFAPASVDLCCSGTRPTRGALPCLLPRTCLGAWRQPQLHSRPLQGPYRLRQAPQLRRRPLQRS